MTQHHLSSPTPSRKPLLAAFMSLLLLGYGQLYNGERYKALLLFTLFVLFSFPLFMLIALYSPSNMMVIVLLLNSLFVLGLWLYAIRQAYQYAKQTPAHPYQTRTTRSFYLIATLVGAFFVLFNIAYHMRHYYVESFHIPSNSMQPTIMAGDILFVDKRYNCPHCKHNVQRGDIVVFFYPNNRQRYYIKRIIGLSGDRIELQDQQLVVNNQIVSIIAKQDHDNKQRVWEEKTGQVRYKAQWEVSDDSTIETMTVPQGSVFVMGDNRSSSEDSRDFGTVPIEDVLGKAYQVWFSWNTKTYRVRWGRLGKVL